MLIAAIAIGWVVGLGSAIGALAIWEAGILVALAAMSGTGALATAATALALSTRPAPCKSCGGHCPFDR